MVSLLQGVNWNSDGAFSNRLGIILAPVKVFIFPNRAKPIVTVCGKGRGGKPWSTLSNVDFTHSPIIIVAFCATSISERPLNSLIFFIASHPVCSVASTVLAYIPYKSKGFGTRRNRVTSLFNRLSNLFAITGLRYVDEFLSISILYTGINHACLFAHSGYAI